MSKNIIEAVLDLTPTELLVLQAIKEGNHTASAIASYTEKKKGHVYNLLHKLEKKGLICKNCLLTFPLEKRYYITNLES